MKNKTFKALLIAVMATAILTGCNSKIAENEIEITTESTVEETTTEEETTTTEETKEEETSTIEEITTEEITTTTDNETQIALTADVTVDGNFTFAVDVDPADKAQILKARDEVSLSVAECDDNGDGLIDKDEAATAAFMYDDETIEALKSISSDEAKDSIVNEVVNEILNEHSSSSSSSNSTAGTGKVETWTADPDTVPQIDFDTPIDHSDLERGVTVY